MNRVELSKHTGVSRRVIERRRDAAIQEGQDFIQIEDVRYRFESNNGRYSYDQIEKEVKINTTQSVQDLKYLNFPLEKRKEAELRYELVREYENRGEKSYTEFMKELPKRFLKLRFTQRQFLRWVNAVRDCPSEETPLLHLVDKRGIQAKEKGVNGEMADAIEKMILEKPHRKAKRIYEYLSKNFSPMPSYETIRKFVSEWKKSNALIVAIAENPDKAKGKYKPAGGSMSESIRRCNQIWELDATPADVICNDGKRYVLSGAIDVFSRRVVIVVEESASYSTLSKVLRKGIKKFGVPESVKIDNGKDYTSNYFYATCSRLRVDPILCPPYSGEYKPHIERFFKTLSHELFEELDGYIGHNVSDREALQSQQSFSKKLESIQAWREKYKNGDEFATRFAVKKENAGLDVGVPLSKEELQLWIDKWILMYEQRRHGSLKTSPVKKWDSDSMPIKTITDERMLDILLGLSTERTVRKKGIEWNGVTYWSDMFGDMVGQRVWVLSDDDMEVVYIYDLEMNYLFTAENPEYRDISRSSYLEANKKWNKKLQKTIKALEELRAEAPERMKEKIRSEVSETSSVPLKEKTVELADEIAVKTETVKETAEADVRINGRPTFTKKFDRFVWDLEHDMVDDTTRKLAKKYPDIWKMAESENERRRAG